MNPLKVSEALAVIVTAQAIGSTLQWNLSNTDTLGPFKCVLIREVFSFQGAYFGTWLSVPIVLNSGCPLTLYTL